MSTERTENTEENRKVKGLVIDRIKADKGRINLWGLEFKHQILSALIPSKKLFKILSVLSVFSVDQKDFDLHRPRGRMTDVSG